MATSVTSGGSLTGITVKLNVSSSDKNPSLTVTITSAEPFQLGSGVTINISSVIFTPISPLKLNASKIKSSPSTSSAINVYAKTSSSLIS